MQITDKFEIVPVAEIKPDERNARKHSDEQITELRRSLREFGFVNPLLIDKNKKIIAGHGRLAAAVAEGMSAVPCIFVEHLTEAQRRAYMLADNRLAEHATWDIGILNEELKFLDDLGFDITITGFDMPEDETEAVDDGYEPELPAIPQSKIGQIYRLGRHRLMCGDSTEAADVALLMDGAQADMLLTDPPYNVDYKGKTKEELTIENDAQSDDEFRDFLVKAFTNAQENMKPGAVFYIWHADSNGYAFRAAAKEGGADRAAVPDLGKEQHGHGPTGLPVEARAVPLRMEGRRRSPLGERPQANHRAGVRPSDAQQGASDHEADPVV